MERLLERAKAVSDQAEVYALTGRWDSVAFANGMLQDVDASRRFGVSLRIVEGGRLGFAFTRNIADPDAFIGNARASLAGGAAAEFSLPSTAALPALPTHDPSIDEASPARLAAECRRVHELLTERTSGEIHVAGWALTHRVRLLNSLETDLSARHSSYVCVAGVTYPGSATGFGEDVQVRRFEALPDEKIDELARLYNAGQREVRPEGGRMKVLFMPSSLFTLAWRLESATSARSVHEGISPISDRVGERVLDEKITIYDDPLDLDHLGARPFDDEGVACRRLPLFTKGVLNGFYSDLHYAAKLGVEPTGHGWRPADWGDDPVTVRPAPVLEHVTIVPGAASFDELVAMMDRGIVLSGVLGAHSGNIPNGDYSVGVNPGLYVENGEIVGRVKDAMVAGNVYETLGDVVAVGNRLRSCYGGRFPPILCDGVSVACQ